MEKLASEIFRSTETDQESRPFLDSDDRIPGLAIGMITRVQEDSRVFVDFPCNESGHSICAQSTIVVGDEAIGRNVALLFEGGDPQKPIIIGLIQKTKEGCSSCQDNNSEEKESPLDIELDGEKVTLTAKKEIILRCGKASITLTHSGKILIRGNYLLNRSSGVNKIKGGSVQIN